ncbi:MAG: phosphoribosyltransferase [Candidatus Doudnabacteria bacterium]|nr:phosphoribosyltransferase [Candidatus Doudnabacteria bacterium]
MNLGKFFKDRNDAGKQLAKKLLQYKGKDCIVLALPRGGVIIGYFVAQILKCSLDVVVARKLGAPFNPEFGVGAIAPGGVTVLDQASIRALGIRQEDLGRVVIDETAEMKRRIKLYRGSRPPLDLKNKIAILVDDGLATGVTARAAIDFIKAQKPKKLILAVPVAAADTASQMRELVDEFVCLLTPVDFMAVGLWYESFEQVTDEEVVKIMKEYKA